MRNHGFNPYRGGKFLPWWETLFYAGALGVSVYIPYTRLNDNRHHMSDVITGGVVGGLVSMGFFFWQEKRYQNAAKGVETLPADLSLSWRQNQKSLNFSFVW